MTPPKSCIATKVCALLALLLSGQAGAGPIGVVTDSSGPLLAKTATGSIKVLAVGSPVELSETLVSRTGTYALVTLTDHTAVVLGPDTELAIEKYSFQEKGPQADEAVLTLSTGSVRITSGVLGTRDTDTFTLKAGTAVIDIRHSTFIAEYRQRPQGELAKRDIVSPPTRREPLLAMGQATGAYTYVQMRSFDAQTTRPLELSDSTAVAGAGSPTIAANPSASLRLAQAPPGPGSPSGMNPGLYVQVLDGTIHVTNGGGSQNFTAGQFGFTPNFQQPPIILPNNPGIQFTPPPSFTPTTSVSTTSGPQGGANGGKEVDCIVR